MGKHIKELKEKILEAMEVGKPFLVIGPHGSGKREMCREITKSRGQSAKYIDPSYMTLSYILGELSTRYARATAIFLDVYNIPIEMQESIAIRVANCHNQIIMFAQNTSEVPDRFLSLCETTILITSEVQDEQFLEFASSCLKSHRV
jgi:hypothetical protein